jgi:hypothetical protein
MNAAQRDYTLLHAQKRKTGTCAPYGDWRRNSQAGRRSKSLARVALKEEASFDKIKAALRQPADHQLASVDIFKSAAWAPCAPFVIDLGAMGGAPGVSSCTSDHNVYASRPGKKHQGSTAPLKKTPKELFEASAALAAGVGKAATLQSDSQAVATCTHHLRSTADALRNYNVLHPHHRQPSAISSISTTYARAPKAPHNADATIASPSERIASNYSLRAWGLSARTLAALSPAGVRSCGTIDNVGLDVKSLSTASKRVPFMPLELFDDEELEVKPPVQWLEGSPAGTVRGVTSWLNLNTGQQEHRAVRVLSYSALARTFAVEFEGSGVKKDVKRLNLRFDAENAELFARRVGMAQRRRAEAEAELRWRFTVDAFDAEEVMEVYDFAAKLAAVRQECPKLSDTVFNRLAPELTEGFNENLRLAVRISQFNYHRLNPSVEQQLQVLGLPDAMRPSPASAKGVQSITPEDTTPLLSYSDALAWARSCILGSSSVIALALQVWPSSPRTVILIGSPDNAIAMLTELRLCSCLF